MSVSGVLLKTHVPELIVLLEPLVPTPPKDDSPSSVD